MALVLRWLSAALVLAVLSAQAAQPARVRLIAFNDLHGHLEPGDLTVAVPDPADPTRAVTLRSGGAAFLATRIAQLQREAPASVVVASGDLLGASPLISALFRDEPTVEVMNLIGLDLNAVGNHEFDHGVDELKRLVAGGCAVAARGATQSCAHPSGRYAGASFPFIAANVADRDGQPLLAPSVVKRVDGLQIGFIGAVTRSTPGIVAPQGIRGWRFEAEAAAVNREARRLRAQGVDVLVAAIHEGGEADGGINGCEAPRGAIFEIEKQLDPAIAVVLSAHTHRAYRCLIGGRLVIQAGSFGRLLSVIDLTIDRNSGAVRIEARNEPLPNGAAADPALHAAYPPLAPEPRVAALIEHYRLRAAPLAQRPAGRIAARFVRQPDAGGDSAAGRLIADAQLAATRANGAQIALTNPGGIRTDLQPRANGAVTYADVFEMQPFGNALVTLTLTGAQLQALLESQWSRSAPERVRFLQPSRGFSYAWRAEAPWGQRIDPASLRLDGQPIRPDATYRVTVNSYLADGGDGFVALRKGTDAVGGPLDADALADHLRSASQAQPLAPDPAPRIRRQD
jgi:5'-nucleotidase